MGLAEQDAQLLEETLLKQGARYGRIWQEFVDEFVWRLCGEHSVHGAGDFRLMGTLEDKLAVARCLRPRQVKGTLRVGIQGSPRLTVPMAVFERWIERTLRERATIRRLA